MAVRRPRAAASRDRLLDAARVEFAGRGFDGAKVDRIAARARMNKAMLYYHFDSKAGLYREILRDLFRRVAAAVEGAAREPGPPPRRLAQFVDALARVGVAQPHFPAIWLREMADGGRHLDASVVAEMRRVLTTLTGILDDGRREGSFRPVNPFVIHLNIVAPLLFFAATEPMRTRFRRIGPAEVDPPRHALIAHVQRATLAVLDTGAAGVAPAAAVRRRRRT
jgi:AcrR family transcriptional regulator